MKRLLMTLMALSVPVAALAQQPEGRPATEGIVTTAGGAGLSAGKRPRPPGGGERR